MSKQYNRANNEAIIQEFTEKAKEVNLSLPKLFERSGIAPSQFYRWKGNETSPTYKNILKIRNTIEILMQKKTVFKPSIVDRKD